MKLLNEILGTKYPIIQGGMSNIATGEFAAACSNAGALGIIGAGGMDADTLRQNIRRCKQLTDKPFGVNIMLMHPQADEFAKIVVEEGVPVVTTGAGNPGKYVPMWKAAGIKVIPVVAAAVLAKHLYPGVASFASLPSPVWIVVIVSHQIVCLLSGCLLCTSFRRSSQ